MFWEKMRTGEFQAATVLPSILPIPTGNDVCDDDEKYDDDDDVDGDDDE